LGLSLIAVALDFHLLVVILEVAFALSMVVFVHELGHYAVAKWCGVKVEKFYLGFDVYGLKLLHFTRGETEYGIGAIPFGGYVKMLGQDDNPANAAQERERSQSGAPEGKALDPRSYMAKSVPQRMAIISAGVIMNVIFAFLMAIVAYSLGVREVACGLSAVLPGEAAWKANMQPGDKILQIDDSGDRQLRFRDLRTAVMLADLNKGIDFQIKRRGIEKPIWLNVKPDPYKSRMRPTIGVVPPETTSLSEEKATFAGTPAAKTRAFKPNDKIVAINGKPVEEFADLLSEQTRLQDQSIQVTVERKRTAAKSEADSSKNEEVSPQRLDFDVPPRARRTIGLVMKMGKITAIQADSPAAAADLRAGDFITAIDNQPPTDPMRLPDQLRRRAGETVTLGISREGPSGQDEKLEKRITLRDWPWTEESMDTGTGVSAPALGITYRVLNIVHETLKDSPAALAQLSQDGKPASPPHFAAGDEVVSARFLLPSKEKADAATSQDSTELEMTAAPEQIPFSAEKQNWPYFAWLMQRVPEGSRIDLTLKDGRSTTLAMQNADDWFVADRGFILPFEVVTVKAHTLGEAVTLGGLETRDAVLQVYLFLRKIGSQISLFSLGGPKAIAQAAGYAAYDGLAELLLFLTLLSANLAVINFLPIPLLDGGHMVFLILEGVLRRPVSEKVVVAFHYAGFLFIISLMLFVLGLDFGLIPRPQ
jgi:regulator of sigma E protease